MTSNVLNHHYDLIGKGQSQVYIKCMLQQVTQTTLYDFLYGKWITANILDY